MTRRKSAGRPARSRTWALARAANAHGVTDVDAGLISLSLVLTTVGLPVEIVPLLFTVDWLVGRARAMTNVVSDIAVAVLLDKTR